MSKAQNEQKIGVGVATIIGMNAMIGAGVLAMPSIISAGAGPAGILSYVIAVIFAIIIGLSLGALADLYPEKGWSYIYPAKWGGHKLGMLSAFCYLLGVLIAMGFLVQESGRWLQETLFIGYDYHMLGAAVLVILTLLVLAGAEASSIVQYIIVACVVGPLALTSGVCWLNVKPQIVGAFMPKGVLSVVALAPVALFSLMGFESIASLYSIVKEPRKNVPIACVTAISLVGFIYIIFASGVIFSVPSSYFSLGAEKPLITPIRQAFPSYAFLGNFLIVGAISAIFGTLHSMIWSLSILFTDVLGKSKSGMVKNMLKKKVWNNKVSVVVTAGIMLAIALTMKSRAILDATAFFIVPSYVLSVMLLLFEKKSWFSVLKLRAIVALLGGLVMLYYSSGPIIYFFVYIKGLIVS